MTLSYTKNLHLAVPDFLTEPWHAEFAQAMDSIDEVVFHALIAADVGSWQNSTAYDVGALVINADTGGIFSCGLAHTSSPPPTTFTQEMANHPTYWAPIGLRLASQSEAELGTDNSKYMSPLRVAQAIDAQSTIAAFTTGDTKLTFNPNPAPGWIIHQELGTIGNAISGATVRANADTEALFIMWWNFVHPPLFTSAGAPVAYGPSGASDFANNRRIELPRMQGRVLGVAGSGVGLTPRALGGPIGAETVTQTIATMAPHTHPENPPGFAALAQYPGYPYANESFSGPYAISNITYGSAGGGQPMSIMQPSNFLYCWIKL